MTVDSPGIVNDFKAEMPAASEGWSHCFPFLMLEERMGMLSAQRLRGRPASAQSQSYSSQAREERSDTGNCGVIGMLRSKEVLPTGATPITTI